MDLARQRLADMMEEAKNRRAKLEQDTTQNPEDLTDNTENQLNEEKNTTSTKTRIKCVCVLVRIYVHPDNTSRSQHRHSLAPEVSTHNSAIFRTSPPHP